MSDLRHNGGMEGLGITVEASDRDDAFVTAKLALIEDGKAPGHVIYDEDQGDGTWEVVYTNRPLRGDQSWQGHVRIGNAGSRAD